MVCTWYNKVLWVPVLNKSAIGGALGKAADTPSAREPCGLYTADF
jgi:hypothetical protein